MLDASDSYDPDNDTLSFSWYIDGKLVSSSAKYEKIGLSPGNHQIKIEVSDGIDASDETFSVRVLGESYEGLSVSLYEFSPVQPKNGDHLSITVKVENNGESPVDNIVVALYEDDNEVDKKTISLKGGESEYVTLNTTAKAGVTYSVQVVGTGLDVVPVPIEVKKQETKTSSSEATVMGMNPRTFVLVIVIVIMLIVLLVVFGLIKFSEWKIEQEELRKRAEAQARLASVSDEEAQRVLEMEAAKAAMIAQQDQVASQDTVEEGQYVLSTETYQVEPTAEIYDPTGALKAEMEGMGIAPSPGEEQAAIGGEEQYGLPPMEHDAQLQEVYGAGGGDEIDDLFGDASSGGGDCQKGAKSNDDELEDLFS